MFERHAGGNRAILVHLHLDGINLVDTASLNEFKILVSSAGGKVLELVTARRKAPDPKYFIGSGKADEVAQLVESLDADVVIFNHILSPAQERNLEKLWACRVLDRTGLVLDIFALRARSFEGKLQVELAQLKHISTRLIRGWTHLERQKGGIGMRGPGETQLETDRRLITKRMNQIQGRLLKVNAQREQSRRGRTRAEIPTVSLVGYTNAGKSTLFNQLTAAKVYVADQLFATLDPTLRRLELNDMDSVVLADTVGFISNLPHELVAAFKSTLQETIQAHLLLHVIDATDQKKTDYIQEVNHILKQIEADKVPMLYVYNKIDLDPELTPKIIRNKEGDATAVWISAVSGEGIELLKQVISEFFNQAVIKKTLQIKPQEGRLHALLHQQTHVSSEKILTEGGWEMTLSMTKKNQQQLLKNLPELKTRLG